MHKHASADKSTSTTTPSSHSITDGKPRNLPHAPQKTIGSASCPFPNRSPPKRRASAIGRWWALPLSQEARLGSFSDAPYCPPLFS